MILLKKPDITIKVENLKDEIAQLQVVENVTSSTI